MGTNDMKVPRDWKWILQLAVLLGGIGGGITANNSNTERIQRLEERVFKVETINQLQLDQMKELKETIKELRDELKARKIVNGVASTSSNVAGETHISE